MVYFVRNYGLRIKGKELDMCETEKKEKRMEIKLPYSLYNKLIQEQLKRFQQSKKKPSIGYLIRAALKKTYK